MSARILDARGLICPLPVLKARKVLLDMTAGDLLHVQVTDKAAPKDFRLFCAETGHLLKSIKESTDGADITIECRAISAARGKA